MNAIILVVGFHPAALHDIIPMLLPESTSGFTMVSALVQVFLFWRNMHDILNSATSHGVLTYLFP